ncbi:MAG: LLM class flavin-dependent oxidoreductase [Thermoleophilaceae bacterium]|nr:LLM class flavin-dependent oxidoreductase [Thermoleophilaceae bacterium]
MLEAGRRADSAGFASVGIIDRLVYDNFEPLTTLAAVAAVTERVRLTTAILIAPNRGNAALLAKQAASVDAISGGRLVLGVAIGARDDDYEAAGVPTKGRGRRLEQYMEELQSHWSEGDIGPKPARAGGPPLWVGGRSSFSQGTSVRRAGDYPSAWASSPSRSGWRARCTVAGSGSAPSTASGWHLWPATRVTALSTSGEPTTATRPSASSRRRTRAWRRRSWPRRRPTPRSTRPRSRACGPTCDASSTVSPGRT